LVFGNSDKISSRIDPNPDEFLTKNQKSKLFYEKQKTKNDKRP